MFASNMPQTPSLTSTPGTVFLNRKPNFQTRINAYCHYKLDSQSFNDGYSSLPMKKRTTMNLTFNSFKNEVDPYVHASNWLPQLKAYCKGYLARKRTEELRKKHEAVQIIQRAASQFLDPLVQIFHMIRPTLSIIKLEELKKYLRECIIQIKKLNAERMFIENQLDDVETTLDKSLASNDSHCLSVEGRKSPNIFGKISEIKENANNDTFLKECLDLKIEGLDDIDINFDPTSCQNSKIHAVYEKSDKLQWNIHENHHKLQELKIKCDSLEKEIKDLRLSNSTLDSTSRLMKGIIHKHDREKEEQLNKLHDFEELIKRYNDERKGLSAKLRDNENIISEKTNHLEESMNKCEYFEDELDKKIKAYNSLNQEKTTSDKRVKELEDSMNYSNEIQQELESSLEIQKIRMKDMKKRFMEQIRNLEEDLMSEKNTGKSHIQDLNEQVENLTEIMKQNESTIRRLEREIKDSNDNDGSDEDLDHEVERKLNMQLKNSQANVESLKEELKIMENNYDEMKKKYQDLEAKLDKASEQDTEYKKQIERLKSQIQTLKSTFNETELNLNRSNREKNYINQKWTQSREINAKLEVEILNLKDEINGTSQMLCSRIKDMETLEMEMIIMKREHESKISSLDQFYSETHDQMNETIDKLNHADDENKEFIEALKQDLEDYRQLLDEKEMEQETTMRENDQLHKTIKKLQKRIGEQDEIQGDFEKTIGKLKDENKNLKEDLSSQNTITVSDYRTRDYFSRDSPVSRSNSSLATSSPTSNNSGFFTLPGRIGSNRFQS